MMHSEIMGNLFGKIFLSIVLIAYGFKILYKPKFFDTKYGMFHDYTSIKWPLGIFMIVSGLLVVALTFYKKVEKYRNINRVLMCKTCVKPYYKKDTPDLRCPNCHGELEKLEGFYDRHPELKD